jgi:hypothetical protein
VAVHLGLIAGEAYPAGNVTGVESLSDAQRTPGAAIANADSE